MGVLRRAYLGPISEIAWRIPGWPRRFLAAFHFAERGSMIDMLAAVEHTGKRELRRKYFRHAMDEARHAGVFASRLRALGPQSREQAAMDDAGLLLERGVVGSQTLIERLGEMEFLVFVYVAEEDAVEQFCVYLDRNLPDADTSAALRDILHDEHFHVSYSRAEVEKYRVAGQPVRWLLVKARLRRAWEAWMRFSRSFGQVMSGIWLGILYVFAVGPFRVLARLEGGGWQKQGHPTVHDPVGARAEG